MVPISSNAILIYLAAINILCNSVRASDTSEGSFSEPEAEDRKFLEKVKHSSLIDKKNWLLSLFSRPRPEIHALEKFPIWKIHKYKGIELRPVQIIDVPTSYDYVQPIMYTSPAVMPHTEYGPPSTEYQPQFYTSDEPVPKLKPGGKLASFFSIFKSHRNVLNDLKNWKLGKLQNPSAFAVALPDVDEVPVKGVENIKVPELPQINLPYYSSTFTTGPYVSVTYGTPLQVSTYQEPAPYYGAPPLYDSYGTPLPPDAYSSAPSQPIPSFAPAETVHTDYQPKTHKDASNEHTLFQHELAIKKSGFEETDSQEREKHEPNPEKEIQIV